jgi:hypothetical protein
MLCSARIPDKDHLFRHSVHPVAFRGQALAPALFFHLTDIPGGFLGSLAWERYEPTAEMVHAHGCRMTRRRNDSLRAEGKFKERNRRVYAGAYQLTARAVRALVGAENLHDIVSAEVVHHIEEGEIAHTDLRITLRPDTVDVEGTKTAVVDRLWRSCRGPLKHVCEGDADIADHPSSRLIPAPQGPYSDSASEFRRCWRLIKFRIWSWLLRRVFQCEGL